MNKTIFSAVFLFLFTNLCAQQMESGDVFDKVTGIINNLPGEGSNEYTDPTAMEQSDWADMLDDLFAADYPNAETKANALGYELIEFSDNPTGETYYILEEDGASNNYWGTYILNPAACRSELILMAPHPKKDFNTGKQAIYCFQELDAFFFMLAGTNRCNHDSYSSCDGTTTICTGSSEDYRISDLAHVTEAIWQKTTEYVHDNIAGTYFVQLHGFSKEPTDPYVIMSNGSRDTPNPDKIAALRDELFIVDPVLDFKIGHIDLAWDRLLGFTNTNGRYINSSLDICDDNATGTNGRFLHVEQEKIRLRNDILGWNKMGVALGEAFNDGGCPSLALLPVELVSFTVVRFEDGVKLRWETVTEINHDYFSVERSADGISFNEIASGISGQSDEDRKVYEFVDNPFGERIYYRLRQVDLDGTFEYSNVVAIDMKNDTDQLQVYLSNNKLAIKNQLNESLSINLYNGLGQIIIETILPEFVDYITLPDLSQGIYFYNLKNESGRKWTGRLWID